MDKTLKAKPKIKLLSRTTDYRITETIGDERFVGKRVRIILNQEHEEVPIGALGFLYDLEGYMLSGPMKENVVNLPPIKIITAPTRRCACGAYKYPHAPGFGECQASKHEESAPTELTIDDLTGGRLK